MKALIAASTKILFMVDLESCKKRLKGFPTLNQAGSAEQKFI
jgi:hypothetical protein